MASDEFGMQLRLEAERRRRAGEAGTPADIQEPDPTAVQVYRHTLLNSLLNGALATPSASGDLLAAGGALVEGLSAPLAGEPMDFRARFQQQQQQFPASLLRAIPRPTVQDIAAGIRSVPSMLPGGESPGAAYARNRDQIDIEEQQLRNAHPIAGFAGDISGNILSLITGKAPMARRILQVEDRIAPKVADMAFGGAVKPAVQPGIRRTLDRALNAEGPRHLARGAMRSLETGLEGAVMEVMNDKNADPIEAAALSAGGQAVGSALLEGGKGLLSGGMLKAGGKVALTAGSIGAMWQLFKAATPGGRDRVLESLESGFDKVAFSIMLGGLAAVSGAPRYRDTKLAEEIPWLVEGLSSVPRGVSLSLISRYAHADPEEQQVFGDTLHELSRNPEYVGNSPQERAIVRAIKNAKGEENKYPVTGVIDRSAYDSVQPQQLRDIGATVNDLGAKLLKAKLLQQ